MSKALDVYRDWLGIKEPARPLNHYQLLRVDQFEDDAGKIRRHYRKMNAHVRKYATGDYASESQRLLNELAKAMLCLTDAQRKSEYDATLGRKTTAPGKRRTLEQLLLLRKLVTLEQLEKARRYADAVGLEVRDALVQQKLASADVVMPAWAESIGLPYIELADVGIDERLVPKTPTHVARQHSCVPVMVDDGQVLMASPRPLRPVVEDDLRVRYDMPVRSVLCTPEDIHVMVEKYYPRESHAAESAKQDAATASGGANETSKSKPKGLFGRMFKK